MPEEPQDEMQSTSSESRELREILDNLRRRIRSYVVREGLAITLIWQTCSAISATGPMSCISS